MLGVLPLAAAVWARALVATAPGACLGIMCAILAAADQRQSARGRTPPQTTMWPSPPSLSLSISSAVSPAAMVVSAHSAVFRVREKTTLRAGFRIGRKG